MFTDNISVERQEAHNSHVANKIIDMMDKLRLSSNSNSPRRWVWELLQNAKDVTNASGKVKVNINLNEDRKILEFSHNGKPFTTRNIVFLIEQVSTKERDDGEVSNGKKTTGKFGTGFLTTHLLSETVTVNSYLVEENETIRNFKVTLDRSGKNKEDIINSINKSFTQLEQSEAIEDANQFQEDAYNTVFKYILDEKGLEVAKKGLEDLKISIPYVMALNPQIEEVKIESEDITYTVIKEFGTKLENSTVYKIQEVNNANKKDNLVMLVEDSSVKVGVALEIVDNKVWIKPFDQKQPKIFCDFPLVGTDDFPFPIIIDSSLFNPTEPRDGVYLTDSENEKIIENKRLILKACELYNTLLNYASEKNWLGLYNATNIKKINQKEWHSAEWIKGNIVERIKSFIKHCPLIDNAIGERIPLFNDRNEIQIEIPSHTKDFIRMGIWELCNKWIPRELPRKEDVDFWYESLWSECKNFDLESLTRRIEHIKEKNNLSHLLESGSEPEEWLNEYYNLISKDKGMIERLVLNKFAVLPNQNGFLKTSSELLIDNNIDEEYKEILILTGEDCREYLLDNNINIKNFIEFEKISNENIISKISNNLNTIDDELEETIYTRILILKNEEENKINKNIKVFAEKILGNHFHEERSVKFISDELQNKSIRFITNWIADEISTKESMDNFVDAYNFDSYAEGLIWLNTFIEFLVQHEYENLINKTTRPILPNQNGIFLTKDDLFLDDGEIDEELKDIATECGFEIRDELLDKKIYLELPENREKHSKDVAEPIIIYVKENAANRINISDKIKSTFKKIFIWMEDNPTLAKNIFSEIWDNKHWLYDDNEIAANMRKAEAYEVLLEKYGIKDTQTLEVILKERNSSVSKDFQKEGLTEDLLIQSGIYSEAMLENAMENSHFSNNFIHLSQTDKFKYEFVNKILERSKKNVLAYLSEKKEYNLDEILEIDKTIYLIEKNGEEIYIIIRPSDYAQVILYYESEKDILDYEKDWELWVEDGVSQPEKITFGKMLKLTGINKIPLRKVR